MKHRQQKIHIVPENEAWIPEDERQAQESDIYIIPEGETNVLEKVKHKDQRLKHNHQNINNEGQGTPKCDGKQ